MVNRPLIQEKKNEKRLKYQTHLLSRTKKFMLYVNYKMSLVLQIYINLNSIPTENAWNDG